MKQESSNNKSAVKIFVGTDPRMKKAEIALEYSIRVRTQEEVHIVWMDYSRGGLWVDWNIGREHGKPYSSEGWATDFSCFRFAVPEANHFEGPAIYLDVDMILLRSIKELLDFPRAKPVLITPTGFDVILFDCSTFGELSWWPTIEQMKRSGWTISDYKQLLSDHEMVGPLPPKWNCCDGEDYNSDFTCLLHFTDMLTQPWKPYPDVFEYLPHPRPDVVDLWQRYYQEGCAFLGDKAKK